MKFDEESVQKCYDVLHTWTPVFEDSYDIVPLSSGVNASPEVQQDLLHAKTIGEEKSSTFIQERIKSNDVPFNHPIKKNNLKTFSSMKVKKSTKVRDKNVLIKADRDSFGRMLILQEKRGKFIFILFHVNRLLNCGTWELSNSEFMKDQLREIISYVIGDR